MRTCTNCGATVTDTDEFCGNCGTYLAWLKPDAPDPRPQAADGEPSDGEPAVAPPADEPAVEPAGEPQPRAVAPARPVAPARAPSVAPPSEPIEDGQQCPHCETVNPAGAMFCRHCGTPLTDAAPVGPITRRRRRHRTGESPWPRRIVALVVLVALVVAGFVLAPDIDDVAQNVLDKLSTPTELSPSQVSASAASAGQPVSNAVDGISNSYWGAPSVGAWAQFTFAQPFRLLGVVITPGASTDPTVFATQARPTKVELDIITSTGATTVLPITLADKPGPQTTDTGISDVRTIRLVIDAAAGQSRGRVIALGEIEFFKRS